MDELKKIIKILPYEIILLNFLKKTYNDDIRDFMLKTSNFSMYIGYISKIIDYYNTNTLHLFRINNELYINHNLYDYIIKDNQIIPEIYDIMKDIDINDFQDIHKNLFKNNADFIIIQEEYADIKETEVFNNFISQNNNVFAIKSYISDIKLNNYNIDIIILDDCIYFIDNNQKFMFKDGKIESFDWNIDKIDKPIMMSIYKLKDMLN